MQRIYKQAFFILLIVSLFMSSTGCWSSKEITDLGISLAMALDKGKESKIEKELGEEGGNYPKKDIMTMTYHLIHPEPSGGGDKGTGSQQKSYINISGTGDSLHQIA